MKYTNYISRERTASLFTGPEFAVFTNILQLNSTDSSPLRTKVSCEGKIFLCLFLIGCRFRSLRTTEQMFLIYQEGNTFTSLPLGQTSKGRIKT